MVRLLERPNPFAAYFALTMVAGQLAACQRRLTPGSRFFHLVKEQLAADIRAALIEELAEPAGGLDDLTETG